eukprot:8086010-Pyramimonas_sp.AAC.1
MFEKQKLCIREVVQQEVQTAVTGLQGQISTQGAELKALRADLQSQGLRLAALESGGSVAGSSRSTGSFQSSPMGGPPIRQFNGDKARKVSP